jgi:CDP-diacylglycerol--serine O-phosphatidyltransferase
MAGAARLARFNIQMNPQPSNPGRPGKKYFVGMPIPAGAGVIAAVVHFAGGAPLQFWPVSAAWGFVVLGLAFLMVSTWRFYSFKELNFGRPLNFRWIIVFGGIIALNWFFSRYVLMVVAVVYTFAGIFARLSYLFRRPNLPQSHSQDEASRA